jgi:outer membrane protein, adhesin transport system
VICVLNRGWAHGPPKTVFRLLTLALLCRSVIVMAAAISIPLPSERPQGITAATDTFLQLLDQRDASSSFVSRLGAAAAALPTLGERAEDAKAEQAARDQARSRLFPVLGLDFVGARTITRDLQSPLTQVENLSPLRRNDVIGSVDQLVTDFGASSARIRAGNATTDAARAELDSARNASLLQLVESWYNVLTAQTASALIAGHVNRMAMLSDGAALRFERGVDSGGDVARARSYLAAAQSQKMGIERRLRSAEARFVELYGAMPGLLTRPVIGADGPPADSTTRSERPEVVAARAAAVAAEAALSAARSDRLPRIDARVSGSAYDVLRGSTPAYDVRAQLTLRQRFSIGGAEAARVAELAARSRSAGLAVDRITAATERERITSVADVDGLSGSLTPLEAAYLDSRRARDLFAEQFQVSRGTLFDVLRAEQDLLNAALSLAQTSYDLDVARFTLLARQGGLIERFGMTPVVATNNLEPRP